MAKRDSTPKDDKFTVDVLRTLQKLHQELAERYSVRSIGVFGSYAKGSADPESDIDILVDLAEPTFDNYMDLKFRLEDIFGRSVDLVLADTLKPRLKPIITKEVVYA